MAAGVLAVNALSRSVSTRPDYREGVVSAERPLSLNPLLGATDPAVRDLGELLYRRLLTLDGQGLPAADLASAYSVSGDGLTYHLPLRRGQQWSDGRPITVADAIATVSFLQSPAFGDPATAAPWQDVHVRADGDGLSFDLAAPRAAFAAELTRLPILPLGGLSASALGRLSGSAAQPLPTSGPFRVASASLTQVELVANAHSAHPPHLSRAELDLYATFDAAAAAFGRGEVDAVLTTDPAQRARLVGAGGSAHQITTLRFVDLLFNERRPQLADAVVRQAIATTLDRGALVREALGGLGAAQAGAISEGFRWAQAPPSPTAPAIQPNPQAALAALTADGWAAGADGLLSRGRFALNLDLAVADVVPLPALAEAIRAQLRAVGIGVRVTSLPATSMLGVLATTPPTFDMVLADWDTGADPDISAFWRSTAVPPAGFNVAGGQVDPFLDQALDRLATLTDPVARRTAAAAVTSQLADDLPALFIETPAVALVVRPALVVAVPPAGDSGARFADISGWRQA